MKAVSTALAGQRKQYVMRRKRAKTDLEFSYSFSVVVLTYLSTGFVSTAAGLVWDPFSELIPKWRPQTSAVFTLSYQVLNWISLPHRVRLPINVQTPYFRLVSEGGHIFFRWFHTCTEYLGHPVFSSHFKLPKSLTLDWLTLNKCFGCSVDCFLKFLFLLSLLTRN